MACDGQITQEDLTNAKDDTTTLAEIATSKEGGLSSGDTITVSTDRFGNTHLTTEGAIARITANPINGGIWAVGITFNAYNDYMIYNGVSYKPRSTTNLPYVSEATPNSFNVEPFDQAGAITTFNIDKEYNTKDIVIDDLNGYMYTATETTTGVQPSTDATGVWSGSARSIPISAVEGDTLLSTAVNNRLRIQANLGDLVNIFTARTNLDVYSKSEVDANTNLASCLFDGNSPVSISSSKNVLAVTRLGTGHYYIAFTTALASANYVAIATASNLGSAIATSANFTAKTNSGFEIITTRENSGTFIVADFDDISVVVSAVD